MKYVETKIVIVLFFLKIYFICLIKTCFYTYQGFSHWIFKFSDKQVKLTSLELFFESSIVLHYNSKEQFTLSSILHFWVSDVHRIPSMFNLLSHCILHFYIVQKEQLLNFMKFPKIDKTILHVFF